MRRIIGFIRVCPLITFLFFLLLFVPPYQLDRVSSQTRNNYLRRAKIWQKQDISAVNLLLGPPGSIAVLPDTEVECHYVEEPGKRVGATPKFKCKLPDTGEIVRIKFSRRETFAEVAGTRLLWALGFFSDATYPVKLRCFDCPELDPSKPGDAEKRMERLIEDAVMERSFDGSEIAQFPDQGWKWSELDVIDPGVGGAAKAEVDALKLLAVFLQHSDSKPSQQRLGCYSQDLRWQDSKQVCSKPVAMIQDLGATFGTGDQKIGAFSAMYYKGWERSEIWYLEKEDEYKQKHGRTTCFGRLTSPFKNGLIDPEISEDGRRFLADLLNQLTDDQIRDLFQAARADQTQETTFENGRETRVTIEHWSSAFKKKRDQINQHRCGPG